MQLTQLLLADEQALKVRLAIDLVLQDPERFVMTDEERNEYERLAVFFGTVASDPSRFAPTGEMAQTVKSLVRRARGPAQPQSGRNKRKVRQERRQGFAKRRRAQRREFAEAYNAAVERVERDMAEKYDKEPKFMILRADGVPIMTDIPASMVVPMVDQIRETEEGPLVTAPLGSIILPGNVEKAMERENA